MMPFAPTQNPLSILIVDDEEPIRDLLGWMLGDAGHRVHQANGGAEALAFLSDHGPVDIVLSDINMPDMDGMELSRRITDTWPALPILLISGRPPPVGVRAFIAKPFRWETLSRAIAALAGPASAGRNAPRA